MSVGCEQRCLHTVAPHDGCFDQAGLAHVEAIVLGGLAVFPAAVLLVVRNGGVVFHRAYGFLDPDTRLYATQTDSLFDLASLTKLFTATAFMTLVEAGQVALDTPVAEVLPEFTGVRPVGPTEDPLAKTEVPTDPAFAGQAVDARQVTFWHLLTHTSGLAAWRSLYREDGQEADVPLPHQVSPDARERRVQAIHGRYGFAYPPGQRTVYSDLGIILLGEAIARLSGASLAQYVQQSLPVPLRLAHTAYNPLAQGILPVRIVPTEFCGWRKRRGAATVALTCNPDSPLARQCEIVIAPVVGPEVITGSSRMKAGTTQKMVLHVLSTASMIRLGKVYENLMVDVQPTNAKLRRRAVRILQDASGAGPESAREALEATNYDVKTSLVMLLTGADADEARRRLGAANGFVRRACLEGSPRGRHGVTDVPD